MRILINETQFEKLRELITEGDKNKVNVLFVGDSLSAGEGYTWNYLLTKRHPEWNVDNESAVLGGMRTDWMLEQLRNAIRKMKSQGKKYDLVFIWGGTNDMFSLTSINTAISNIQQMVNLVNLNGGKAVVFAGYDAKSVMELNKLQPTIYCDKECIRKARLKMINFQDELEEKIVGAKIIKRIKNSSITAGDGIHVDGNSHNLIANHVDSNFRLSREEIKQEEEKPFFFSNWYNSIKDFLTKSFGLSSNEKKLTNTLVNALENPIQENKIVSKKDFLLLEDDTLEYKQDFMKYDNDVVPIQLALQLLKYSMPEWGADGLFGPETEEAVIKFQEENNMEPTGVVDNTFRKKLAQEIKSKGIDDDDFTKLKIVKTATYDGKKKNIILQGKNFRDYAKKLHGSNFVNRVEKIADRFNLSPDIIFATMYFESLMDPAAQNPYSRATGLIQFMPFTASALGTSIDQLRNMSAIKQLDYVEKFYEMNKSLIPYVDSPEEAYFLVFYPYAVQKSNPNYVLGSEQSSGTVSAIASQNKPFDANNDGKIQKKEVENAIRKKWGV